MNDIMVEKRRDINIKKIHEDIYETKYLIIVKKLYNDNGDLNQLWSDFCNNTIRNDFSDLGFKVYFKEK